MRSFSLPAFNPCGADDVILQLIGAILFASVRPRSTQERLMDVPRWFAPAVHGIGLLLIAVVLLLPEWPRHGLIGGLREELFLELGGAGPGLCVFVVFFLFSFEAAHWLLALILVAWGSWRAPVREVWRRSLRVAWLFTPQIAWITLVLGVVNYTIAGLGSHAIGPYNDELSAGCFALLTLASIASLLRAVTAHLPEQANLALKCEWCGYNLSHQPADSDCPECGTPVQASSDESLRRADVWPVRTGRQYSFFGCHRRAWLDPEPFFRGLTTRDGLVSAGLFLMVNLGLSVVGFLCGFFVTFVLFEPDVFGDDWWEAMFFVGGIGGVAALILGSLASLTAAAPGMLISRRHGQNRVGACMQPACFCSGLFPIWSTTFSTMFVTLINVMFADVGIDERWFRSFVFMAFVGTQLVFLLLYIFMVLRRFGYTVHANR